MNKSHLSGAICALICSFITLTSHAAIIHYELSGTIYFADINWNSITSSELSGYMNISDTNIGSTMPRWEIEGFVFRADGFEWSGIGSITKSSDVILGLDGPGDWDHGTAVVGCQGAPDCGWWAEPFQLPEVMSWPGFGWTYRDELQYQYNIASFNLQAVPIPAAVWLFCSGLIGLIGISRRKKAE